MFAQWKKWNTMLKKVWGFFRCKKIISLEKKSFLWSYPSSALRTWSCRAPGSTSDCQELHNERGGKNFQFFLNHKAIDNIQLGILFGKTWPWKGTRYEVGSSSAGLERLLCSSQAVCVEESPVFRQKGCRTEFATWIQHHVVDHCSLIISFVPSHKGVEQFSWMHFMAISTLDKQYTV